MSRISDIRKLSKAEQLELYQELVEVLAEDDGWDQLSPEVIAELDKQLDEYRSDPSKGKTWEEVKARIQAGEWRKWQK